WAGRGTARDRTSWQGGRYTRGPTGWKWPGVSVPRPAGGTCGPPGGRGRKRLAPTPEPAAGTTHLARERSARLAAGRGSGCAVEGRARPSLERSAHGVGRRLDGSEPDRAPGRPVGGGRA